MNGDAVRVGFERNPPDIRKQLPLAHPFTRLLRETPKKLEFTRMQGKPAILDAPISVQQIERNVAGLAKSRNERIAIWKDTIG